MSVEQGDVEIIREALNQRLLGYGFTFQEALAALDRLAADLERAERERDEALKRGNLFHNLDLEARAEKAERALGEIAEADRSGLATDLPDALPRESDLLSDHVDRNTVEKG